MTKPTVVNCAGLAYLLTHGILVVLLLILIAKGGLSADEGWTLGLIALPVFTAQVTGFTKAVIRGQQNLEKARRKLSEPAEAERVLPATIIYAIINIAAPLFVAGAIVLLILAKAYNLGAFYSFSTVKVGIAVVESAYAVNMTRLSESLFSVSA